MDMVDLSSFASGDSSSNSSSLETSEESSSQASEAFLRDGGSEGLFQGSFRFLCVSVDVLRIILLPLALPRDPVKR